METLAAGDQHSTLTHVAPWRRSGLRDSYHLQRSGKFFCSRNSKKHFTGVETGSKSWQRNREKPQLHPSSALTWAEWKQPLKVEYFLYSPSFCTYECDWVQLWGRDGQRD